MERIRDRSFLRRGGYHRAQLSRQTDRRTGREAAEALAREPFGKRQVN